MIKLIGIFNIVFLVSVMGFIIARTHKFSFKRKTLSQLVKFTKYKTLFDITLFVFAVNQVILCTLVYLQYKESISIYTLILLAVGGLFLCFASFLTVLKHPNLHLYTALISGTLVWLGLITLSIALINIDMVLALILLFLTILISIVFLFKQRFKGGYWEVVILIAIFCCNVILTMFLYK